MSTVMAINQEKTCSSLQITMLHKHLLTTFLEVS